MPNPLAHTLVVKKFYTKEGGTNGSAFSGTFLSIDNSSFFKLGALGPDPLFYCGILPFDLHLPTAQKRVGNKIHKTDAKRFFELLCDRYFRTVGVADNTSSNKYCAFVFGQFAHYVLDYQVHPYVLYKTGFDENGKITGVYHYRHAYFEQQMDYCLAKYYGMPSYYRNPKQEFLTNRKEDLQSIDEYFVPVLRTWMQDEKLPKHMYRNSVRNMGRLMQYMNRNGKFKSKLFGKNNLGALAVPYWDAPEDVLNGNHDMWKHPVTGEERYESYYDLLSRSYDIIKDCYYDILHYGFNYQTFSKYLNGLDYYGCQPGEKWKFHE